MDAINRLNATPQTTTSTSYERRQSVVVSSETRRQPRSETRITTQTTTNVHKKITETTRELEARINAQKQQEQVKNTESEAKKEKTAPPANTDKGVVLEQAKRILGSLTNTPEKQNGSLVNTVV